MAEEVESLKFNSENRALQRSLAIYGLIRDTILKPPEWLERLQSPFKWVLQIEGNKELVNWNIPGKLCDYDNQGAFYGFEKLAFLLVMLFMKTIGNEEDKLFKDGSGLDTAEDEDDSEEEEEDDYEPEKDFAKCRETVDEMASNEGDTMYSRIGPALEHVLQATKAHLMFFSGNIAESQELARNILPANEMSRECKAGFLGIRAKFVMSCIQNYQIVLPYLHKAMELDPDFGYWPYLVGKVIRRARREFKEDVIGEELDYFEKAVSLERNPKFVVFLAQAYQETAQAMFYSRGPIDSTNNFLRRAVELYSECWRLKNDSAAIARRVGNGMMKMRAEFIDKAVAKEALLKSVELSPNDCTNIALGKFYYLHEKNDELALEHFKKSHPGDFGSSEIIRLNLIRDPSYDPYDIIKPWLKLEVNAVKQYKSFCDAAWYYLVFKKDLESAAKYIWKVLVRDDKSIRAKTALEFKSYGFCVEGPINLVEVLVNEILVLKEKNVSLRQEEQKDMKLLENFLEKFLEKYPDLCNISPRPNLVEDLKRNVDRYIADKRKRRYGSGHNRRNEPCRGPQEPGSWRNNHPNDGAQEHNDLESQRQQEGDGNRRYSQWYNSTNRESNGRYETRNRHSFSVEDDERRNRGYSRDDGRRLSESQSNWSNPRTADVGEGTSTNRRFDYNNRERSDRQYNSHNNNRYDVTITDWRSENRRQ